MASNASAQLLQLRTEGWIVDLLEQIAKKRRQNTALVIETLITHAAVDEGLLTKDSRKTSLLRLLEAVGELLDENGAQRSNADVTLWVFQRIKDSSELVTLHKAALVPPSRGVTAEKRRQFVHQRIGRFVKEHLGLESGEEIILPRGFRRADPQLHEAVSEVVINFEKPVFHPGEPFASCMPYMRGDPFKRTNSGPAPCDS